MASESLKHHGGLLAHANIEAYKRGLAEGKDSSDEEPWNDLKWSIFGVVDIAFDLNVKTVTNGDITEFSTKQDGKILFHNDQAFECKLMVAAMYDPEGDIRYGFQTGLFIRNGNMKAVLPGLTLESNFDVALMFKGGYLAKFVSTNIGFDLLLAQFKADEAVNDKGLFKKRKDLISSAFEIDLPTHLYFKSADGAQSAANLINSAEYPGSLIICRMFMERVFKNITDDLNQVGDQLYEKLQSVSKMPEEIAQQIKDAWIKAGSTTTGKEIKMPPGIVSEKRLPKMISYK